MIHLDFSQYSFTKLKEMGHELLSQYVALDDKRTVKDAISHAYEKLGNKLKTQYGRHHFSKMESRQEVIVAIGRLRKMIKQRKKKIEFTTEARLATKVLPQAEMKKALASLSRGVS